MLLLCYCCAAASVCLCSEEGPIVGVVRVVSDTTRSLQVTLVDGTGMVYGLDTVVVSAGASDRGVSVGVDVSLEMLPAGESLFWRVELKDLLTGSKDACATELKPIALAECFAPTPAPVLCELNLAGLPETIPAWYM